MEGTVHGVTELDMTERLSLSVSLGVDIFVTYLAWYYELPGSVVWYLSLTGKILPLKFKYFLFSFFFLLLVFQLHVTFSIIIPQSQIFCYIFLIFSSTLHLGFGNFYLHIFTLTDSFLSQVQSVY